RGIQVNIEVNGHCGYDNDTTVPLFQNSGVDKANLLPARANKAIRPREDPVPVDKPTGASPPWNTLGAKPKKKSYPLQRLTGRAKRPDINNETDWPALASQTAASTSTPLSAQAQKWTSVKGRSITKSQTQFHVELGNRFAPLLNDLGSGSNEVNTQPSGTAKTESASGKQKRHGRPKQQPHLIVGDVSVKDAQKMFSSNVKVICLPNDTVSDLADKILHIVADYPHLKNVVIHFGLNDLAKEESEVLKQDFTQLLKTVSCIQPKVFISGPIPPVRKGDLKFSRIYSLNKFLSSACAALSLNFIENFPIFWERRHLFRADGLCLNKAGVKLFTSNLFYFTSHTAISSDKDRGQHVPSENKTTRKEHGVNELTARNKNRQNEEVNPTPT
uniref:SGNH hydrolase-type esterase domain-containing protein n=1 Tax=Gouania willdenowi TaxID=441366 RepID=A0A8C5DJ96_GOUWI